METKETKLREKPDSKGTLGINLIINAQNRSILERTMNFCELSDIIQLSLTSRDLYNNIRKTNYWQRYIIEKHIWTDNM